MRKNHIIYGILEKRSFRGILIFSFVFVSIIPILVLQYFSYNRLSQNLQDNMNRLSMTNVAQTSNNLKITLDAYNDLLYQIYTNDEAVSLIKDIDDDNNQAVAMNQLNRMLRGMCYAKDGIEAISIITKGGNVIYYDKIAASSVNSSWLGKDNLSADIILEKVLMDNSTNIFPTTRASNIGSNQNYLFHMTHRMIDYKQIDKDIGVAVISINEDILKDVCNNDMPQGTFSFIADKNGRVISYPNRERIGEKLSDYDFFDANLSQSAYRSLISDDGYMTDLTSLYSSDPINDWIIVNVVEQSAFYGEIAQQQRNMLIVGIVIIGVAAALIIVITTLLARSMNKVTDAMKQAQNGDLSVSVLEENVFSSEMMTIVRAFNEMILRIAHLIEEVKSASTRQRNAEIKALEAQINPHFLYNILDSINWMAIDNDQFELSHMITSLAKILRYSINNSNATVALREEIEWLRQYVYLQQMRSKNSFEYNIETDETALDYTVHKLILQPFVENSIRHGFKDDKRKNLLSISVVNNDNLISITIHDNGCGIEPSVLDSLSENQSGGDDHIGMANAIGRIRMYYGDNAEVNLDSEQGAGTTVTILFTKGSEA